MDKLKNFKNSWQAFLAVTVVMVWAGTLVLPAADKAESGYLGVSVQRVGSDVREKLGIKHGVEVASVEKDSAAAKAGIEEKDIIQLVNGENIRDVNDLVEVISKLAPGSAAKISLWRDGKALEMTATLGKRENGRSFFWKNKKLTRGLRSGGYLGIVLQELNSDLASYFSVEAGEGVLIIRVDKDTPAEKAGLKAGDVIVQLGDQAVKDAGDVQQVLADLKKGDSIAITVVRHGKRETLKAEPDCSRHRRIIRFFGGGKDTDDEYLEISGRDSDIPDIDIEVPPLPDMSYFEEALDRVHEKLDRVKINIGKHLEKIGENFWI